MPLHRTDLVLHPGPPMTVRKSLLAPEVARSCVHSKYCLKRLAHMAGPSMVCSGGSVELGTWDMGHSGCLCRNIAQTVEGDSHEQA